MQHDVRTRDISIGERGRREIAGACKRDSSVTEKHVRKANSGKKQIEEKKRLSQRTWK